MPDIEVVKLALDTLEIFVKNVENYGHITSTFGVREALDSVINKHTESEPKLVKQARSIRDDIERLKPPIYNLHSRCRRIIEPKKLQTHVIVLHVHGLLPVSGFFVRNSLTLEIKDCIISIEIVFLGNSWRIGSNFDKN